MLLTVLLHLFCTKKIPDESQRPIHIAKTRIVSLLSVNGNKSNLSNKYLLVDSLGHKSTSTASEYKKFK